MVAEPPQGELTKPNPIMVIKILNLPDVNLIDERDGDKNNKRNKGRTKKKT
jgi:hypothetical protein